MFLYAEYAEKYAEYVEKHVEYAKYANNTQNTQKIRNTHLELGIRRIVTCSYSAYSAFVHKLPTLLMGQSIQRARGILKLPVLLRGISNQA